MFDFVSVKYLESLGLDGVIEKGREFWMCCPFHVETKPSSKLSLDYGWFKCFGCGKSINIMDFLVSRGKKLSDFNTDFFRDLALSRNNKITGFDKKEDPLDKFRNVEKSKVYLSENILEKFTQKRFPKKFVDMVSYDIILKYEVFFDEKQNVLVFPVRDLYGGLISVTGREYYTGKFFFYDSLYKGLLGIHRVLHSRSIILVEGLRDWILLCRISSIPVVCLMGRELSKKGIEDLKFLRKGYLEEIYLGLDNDNPGIEGCKKLSQILLKNKLCDKLYRLKPVKKDWVKMYEDKDDLDLEKYRKLYMPILD